jgi:putative tryptophan/tyrosine transport system substrate-binding protein
MWLENAVWSPFWTRSGHRALSAPEAGCVLFLSPASSRPLYLRDCKGRGPRGGMYMQRRDFIALLAGGTVARPFSARAQQAQQIKRVGILVPFAEDDPDAREQVAAFRTELQRLGWNDNLRIEARWAGGDRDRIRVLAKELAALRPDSILCRATPVAQALLQETRDIPIVFVNVSDPVGDGLVASLARPGGNVTGFTNVEDSLGGKWLELLKEIDPGVNRVAVIFDPKMSPGGGTYYVRQIEQAAASLHLTAVPTTVNIAAEIEQAVDAAAREPNSSLLVLPDVTTTGHRDLITSSATRRRLPAVYSSGYFVKGGGLISYGVEITDLYRRAAGYVDRILRGGKPSELPVQGPVKFELAINLKTAKALGLTVPPALLARADEVIE